MLNLVTAAHLPENPKIHILADAAIPADPTIPADLAVAKQSGTLARGQAGGKLFACAVHKYLAPTARLKAIRSLDPARLTQRPPDIVPSRRPRPLVALPQVSCERIRHDGRL